MTRTAYGGSCYLNNAAIAAQYLRDRGVERVAVVDIDAHHGNGAQSIFWERADVLTASVHVDPQPAGSRTSSAPLRESDGREPQRPARRRGTGDEAGWPASREVAVAASASVRARSSSHSASMRRPSIPRARST